MPYAYQGDNCYRRGDYYRGDYYRGDPGIFGFLGGVLRGIAPALPLVGPALANVLGPATAFRRPSSPGPGTALAPVGPPPFSMQGPAQLAIGGFGAMNIMQPQVPVGPTVGSGPMLPALRACGIKGLHLNKSTYITRGGGTSHWPQELIVHHKGTECVRVRRMNVANPRAIRRSLRRLSGFAKLARRVLHFTHPRAARGRPAFRFKRKRAA